MKYKCWGCGEEKDPPLSYMIGRGGGFKCECGGYIITPTGKIQVVVDKGNTDDNIIKLD